MRTRLGIVLVVLPLLSAMAAAQGVNAQKMIDLRQYVPDTAVGVRTTRIEPDLWAVTWTQWQGVTAKSHVLVVRTPRVKPFKVIWDPGPLSGEGTAVQPYPQFKYNGHALVFVSVTKGLQESEVYVLAPQQESVRILMHLHGAGVDVQNLGKQKQPVLVEHFDPSTIDVPQLYRWTGDRFCDCSRSFPEFYKFRYQSYGTDWQTFSPALAVNFARLAWLGGDTPLAREVLAQARRGLGDMQDTLSETTRRQLDQVAAEIARGSVPGGCAPR